MSDPRIERLAEVLVDYATAVKPGDRVGIAGSTLAEPTMLALYDRCLSRGGLPLMQPIFEAEQQILLRNGSEAQLTHLWPTQTWLAENLDVTIHVHSEANTRALSRLDPQRMATAKRAQRPLMETRMARAARGELRWNLTLHPSGAQAMEAEMSLTQWEDFFYRACLVDQPDPIACWRSVAERNRQVVDWLQGRNRVHLEGPGTDLHLEVGGRTFVPCSGEYNMPDGEVFTGPLEDRTRGVVSFSYPAILQGVAVEGIRLEFKDGRVVNASADRNQATLLQRLDTDAGARVLGELGIGTNFGISEFTGSTLLDEKIGGTIHLAVGASIPESGGVNQSAIHWDMVCDLRQGGRITVDDEVLMENGRMVM